MKFNNQNKNIRVTIMIPTYNQEKYIAKSIQSALLQDYPNIEVIVSDDSSRDNTKKIVNKFLINKKVKYYRNSKNIGKVKNYRKILYDYATGDYVLNLDGDDYLIDKSYISQAVDLINSNDLVMVFAKQKVFLEKRFKLIEDKVNNKLHKIVEGNNLFINYYKGISIPHLTTIYNRKEAIKINYYKEDIISSDWESVLRLMLNHKVGFINKFVGVWRKHSNNESRNIDIKKIVNNSKFIESPYTFARNKAIFSNKDLSRWRINMLKKYFIRSYVKVWFLDKKGCSTLLNYIKMQDFLIYKSLRKDLRFLFIKEIIKSEILSNILFKKVIKLESFLEDLKK